MHIEVREPNQVTRRRFMDLATKAVAALVVAAHTGKLLVEEAQEAVVALRYNVAVRFDETFGVWQVGKAWKAPDGTEKFEFEPLTAVVPVTERSEGL